MPATYDPDDPATRADPFPLFRRLQREAPVSWCEPLRGWVVVRHADVTAALADPRLSSDRMRGFLQRLLPPLQARYARFHRLFAESIAFSDPPAQTRRKAAAQGALDREHARGLADSIAGVAAELLAPARARGSCEVIGEFARPLACRILARALGVGDDDLAALHALAGEALLFAGRSRAPDRLERARGALEAMADRLAAICDERRRDPSAPGGDWIAGLLAAEARGALSADEVVALALNLTLAGEENVRHGIALGLRTLLAHPDALVRFRAAPARRVAAVDELLRFDGPTQAIARVAIADAELGGQAIGAGDTVYLFLNAANRDPERFEEPDRLDLDRSDARAHLGFGLGIHRCLGSGLARAEIAGALGVLVDGAGELRLVDEALVWSDSLTFRGMERLGIAFSPAR